MDNVNKPQMFTGELGALKPKVDTRDYKLSVAKTVVFPKTYTIGQPNEDKDQSNINSCVPHMGGYVREKLYLIRNGVFKRFSVGFLYANRPDLTMQGMYLRDMFKTLQTVGDVFNEDFDYNLEVPELTDKLQEVGVDKLNALASSNKILTYFQVTTPDEIKSAIMNYGYVGIGVPWYNDNGFSVIINADGSVQAVIEKGSDLAGNHALTIYGWNETGWLISNSWGLNWGVKDQAILPYTYPIDEAWGSTGEPKEDIIVPVTNGFMNFILKIANWFINLFKKK